ncbi:MAG: radical SAM protein [Planctomycetes bacterium]|nr:radical SAM protein [Planctomycetota bacterium]MBL7107101.1 radical SAM protein [Phycisphaerae bacterium]
MAKRILLVNPAIYDFTAYDFWSKPYGLLTVAGYIRGKAQFSLFDYMDRQAQFAEKETNNLKSDKWGRGNFYKQKIPKPPALKDIPRHFHRFGLPRHYFQKFLQENKNFDFALVQTVMTYWYPGIAEVIEDIREYSPQTKIVLGGNYATLCPDHAATLGADFNLSGIDLEPLYKYLDLKPDYTQPALWQAYDKLETAVQKISDGCPFRCTYCSVPKVYPGFSERPTVRSIAEFEMLLDRGIKNIAFYDDALLYKADQLLIPFLKEVIKRNSQTNLHTPNALNARFITDQIAEVMLEAGFKTFYLGFESSSEQWQKKTGGKVVSDELSQAVNRLVKAGAEPQNITAYQILGHPDSDIQHLEKSMHFVNSLGIRGMLADFSPIPSTKDGKKSEKWVDMSKPLFHNKTVFTIIKAGFEQSNRLKDLQRKLNNRIAIKRENSD